MGLLTLQYVQQHGLEDIPSLAYCSVYFSEDWTMTQSPESEITRPITLGERLKGAYKQTESWSKQNRTIAKHLVEHVKAVAQGLGAKDDDPLINTAIDILNKKYFVTEKAFVEAANHHTYFNALNILRKRITGENFGYYLIMKEAVATIAKETTYGEMYEEFHAEPMGKPISPPSAGIIGNYKEGLRIKGHHMGIYYSNEPGSSNYKLHRKTFKPFQLWHPITDRNYQDKFC